MNYEENIERRLNEAENRRLYGEKQQILLVHDIYSAVFRIHRYIEKTMKTGRTKEDFYLAKILFALYYKGDLSQTDIANDYGMPLTTVATIVKKHEFIQDKTEQQNIQDDRFIIVEKAATGKHRTKLVLTDYGKEKAEKFWGDFMKDVLGNMKTIDKKSSDVKYDYLRKIFNSIGNLYNYTVGTKRYTEL